MKFSTLFPHLHPWVVNLVNVWPAYIVKPNFAIWEVFHILSLVMLGGCTILVGLRLMGVGLKEESPSSVYRSLAPYLNVGVVGVVVSGILIGMANAERLYASTAFVVKMIALMAGLLVTYGALRPAALADGRASPTATALGALALLVWSMALFVFATGGLIAPGLLHIVTAAALIVLILVQGRRWLVYVAGVLAVLVSMYLATHVFIPTDDLKRADPANVALATLLGLWVAAFGALAILKGEADAGDLRARVFGGASILIWVSAAAAGRWIAFA